MRKIPTLLLRDPLDRRYVTGEVDPRCAWVLAGEGVASRKWDGTCVLLDCSDRWWARREVKAGKLPPLNWWLVQHDETTGKSVGWEPIRQSPFVRFHEEALADHYGGPFEPGTYELIGERINGNPDQILGHELKRHGADGLPPSPRSVAGVIAYVQQLAEDGAEGVVWHHPDGRMAKLKGRDLRQPG